MHANSKVRENFLERSGKSQGILKSWSAGHPVLHQVEDNSAMKGMCQSRIHSRQGFMGWDTMFVLFMKNFCPTAYWSWSSTLHLKMYNPHKEKLKNQAASPARTPRVFPKLKRGQQGPRAEKFFDVPAPDMLQQFYFPVWDFNLQYLL